MEFILNFLNSFEFVCIFRLILGFLLAGVIGLERATWDKPAGFRTHALVGISAVLITLCGEFMSETYNVDASRISAQLLSGIGFIGAGTILRDGFTVKGLTTAAGLLAVTCIGLSIGAGFYVGGIVTTLIVYLILSHAHRLSYKLNYFNMLNLQVFINENSESVINQIESALTSHFVDIKQLQKSSDIAEEHDPLKLTIICQYNKKCFNKNDLLFSLSQIEHVLQVIEL